ncbi:MAG: NAD-dependent epimerase/dehydratase family protein [Candidatus Dormiibacterota bacterium]|jgi:NADH dehydrogenase
MRIAIAGGTGFVGSQLATHLAEQGHELVLVSRGNRARTASAATSAQFVRADVVTGTGLAEAFAGCQAVVNLVAVIVEKRRQTFDAVNRQGTANVAQAAAAAGVTHLVQLSALGAGPDPRFAYLASKWAGEQAIAISGVPHTIIRSSLVFGPGDGFFVKLARLVRRTPPLFPLPIAGDGRTLFQPIAAADVARCIALALERGPSNGVVSIGGPDHLTYEQIIDLIRGEVVSLPRLKVHVPVIAIKPVATLMTAIMRDPLVTPSQLDLLGRNNITLPGAVRVAFGFDPARFAESCGYLRRRGR